MKEGTCRYYEGCQHDLCAAGVRLVDFNNGDRKGFVRKLPCFGGLDMLSKAPNGATCEKFDAITKAEEDAWVKECDDEIGVVLDARAQVLTIILQTGFDSGSILCPKCKVGNLKYSRAELNGHIHAQCETEGCMSWME